MNGLNDVIVNQQASAAGVTVAYRTSTDKYTGGNHVPITDVAVRDRLDQAASGQLRRLPLIPGMRAILTKNEHKNGQVTVKLDVASLAFLA